MMRESNSPYMPSNDVPALTKMIAESGEEDVDLIKSEPRDVQSVLHTDANSNYHTLQSNHLPPSLQSHHSPLQNSHNSAISNQSPHPSVRHLNKNMKPGIKFILRGFNNQDEN